MESYTDTDRYTDTHSYIDTYSYTDTDTDTDTHTHTHTDTHTHTHSYTDRHSYTIQIQIHIHIQQIQYQNNTISNTISNTPQLANILIDLLSHLECQFQLWQSHLTRTRGPLHRQFNTIPLEFRRRSENHPIDGRRFFPFDVDGKGKWACFVIHGKIFIMG